MVKKVKIFKFSNTVVAYFDTQIVGDSPLAGRRVKHQIYEDEDIPGCYWHEAIFLSEFHKPEESYTKIVSERVFFGKYRLVRERVSFMKDTWLVIADCMEKIERVK